MATHSPAAPRRGFLPVPEAGFRISADGYLVTLAPFYGPVVSIDQPLGAYRQHGENAWSLDASAPGAHLRRSLEHDAHKYRALEIKARDVGMEVPLALGMRDHHHLATRLASLCLDPARHPYVKRLPERWHVRGTVASRHARLPWRRRAILLVHSGRIPAAVLVRAHRCVASHPGLPSARRRPAPQDRPAMGAIVVP